VLGPTTPRLTDTPFHCILQVDPIGALPEIKPASVVTATVYTRDAATPDIFHKLVPFSAHLSASEYSAKKDAILRHVNALVETKDQELQRALVAMDLAADGSAAPKEYAEPWDRCVMCCRSLLCSCVLQGFFASILAVLFRLTPSVVDDRYQLPAELFTKAAVLRDERGEGLGGFEQRLALVRPGNTFAQSIHAPLPANLRSNRAGTSQNAQPSIHT